VRDEAANVNEYGWMGGIGNELADGGGGRSGSRCCCGVMPGTNWLANLLWHIGAKESFSQGYGKNSRGPPDSASSSSKEVLLLADLF
jgi:hypothetical protein